MIWPAMVRLDRFPPPLGENQGKTKFGLQTYPETPKDSQNFGGLLFSIIDKRLG